MTKACRLQIGDTADYKSALQRRRAAVDEEFSRSLLLLVVRTERLKTFGGAVPNFRVAGFEGAEGVGLADDFAGGAEGWDVAEGDGLEHDVAGGGGFGGSGENRNADGVGGKLIEEIVVAAATDDVEQFDFL